MTTQNMQSHRLQSIDIVRGLIMVIMALDHTRDFFINTRVNPADLTQVDSIMFATRWITHFCAPLFVFLAGTSVGLMATRKDKSSIAKFLVTRGLWLIVAEFLIVSLAWQFNFTGFVFALQVILVTGISMILLGGLIWLPTYAILAYSLIIVFGHNALDYGIFPVETFAQPTPIWHFLHVRGYTLETGIPSLMLYPPVPWIGIMPLGYLFASIYQKTDEQRRLILLILGLGSIVLFIVLRFSNLYGDPKPWEVQETAIFTVWSFINTLKYPPSLLFLLMTIGPGFLMLRYAENLKGVFANLMITFGRVPFFFYVLHLYFIHFLALVVSELFGDGWETASVAVWNLAPDYGFPLWATYIMWLIAISLLYPACKWFGRIKATHKKWWLSYL